MTSGASQVAEIVEARRPTNKLKPSLQSPINEKYVTLSEGGSYGLPTRTVTFQARDRDSVPAIVDWDQEAGSYAAKAPAFAHLSWIVER